MKEALLYKKFKNSKIKCGVCPNFCVVSPKKRGICGVRENIKGVFYSLAYGKAVACHIDPIEKKPFFHFFPGISSLSIASAGCNFRCLNCQNWEISQGPKINKIISGEDLSPKEIVETAIRNNISSISYTYTEPSVFIEYALETMKIAKKSGLKNAWVSNGYMSKESFNLISNYIDAINIDLKSFSESFYKNNCGGKLKPVLETLKRLKKKKIWIEITTLVIPGLNDSTAIFKKIAQFISKELGKNTPWHISRFFGSSSFKLKDIPDTPIETLKKAYQIGKETGLKYVYVGNVSELGLEDTFCPFCAAKMIERIGFKIERYDKEGHCSNCGKKLNIIG